MTAVLKVLSSSDNVTKDSTDYTAADNDKFLGVKDGVLSLRTIEPTTGVSLPDGNLPDDVALKWVGKELVSGSEAGGDAVYSSGWEAVPVFDPPPDGSPPEPTVFDEEHDTVIISAIRGETGLIQLSRRKLKALPEGAEEGQLIVWENNKWVAKTPINTTPNVRRRCWKWRQSCRWNAKWWF